MYDDTGGAKGVVENLVALGHRGKLMAQGGREGPREIDPAVAGSPREEALGGSVKGGQAQEKWSCLLMAKSIGPSLPVLATFPLREAVCALVCAHACDESLLFSFKKN